MYEGIDTVVLDAELAYQDVLPLAWQSLTSPLDRDTCLQMADRNLRLLQVCAALEEHGQVDKADDNAPHSADISRLDLKMNLLLDLVGRILIANQPRPDAVHVRFNALGAKWKMPGLSIDEQGVVSIYLKDCLVEPLRLVGRVASVSDDGQVKVKFENTPEALADLIEKLAFRRHRRQVADSKKPNEREAVRMQNTRDAGRNPGHKR